MTVFIVDASLARTGALVCANSIARNLRGKAEVVLVASDKAAIDYLDTQYFSRIIRLPIRPLRRTFKSVILYIPQLLRSSWLLTRSMKNERPSCLILNDFYLMEGVGARLFGFKGPVMTWIRIDPSVFGIVAKIWLRLVKWSSTKIVIVSETIKQKVPNLDVAILYDAIAPRYLSIPVRSESSDFNFVYFGNYISGKGQDIALEAFSKISTEWPEASLSFYGGTMGMQANEIFKASLIKRARQIGLQDRVTFCDFVSDPAQELGGKFAALNLSRSESFSMTVLEASAAGLPVISTRSGGPEEIVEDGVGGLFTPIDDVEACAEAMSYLCSRPERAAEMGREGRARVLANFSEQSFQKNLSALLDIQ